MINLLYENVYKKYKGYTFKNQLFYNNNKRLIYCFVAIKNKKADCLLQWYEDFTKDEKDKVINDYLIYKGVIQWIQ